MLRKGDDISPTLLKAIEESKISIILLSKNYASSTWCLEELTKILECMETKQQMVLSVFYQVDRSEVRKQTMTFKKPLADLEKRFKNDIMKVRRWREALTIVANLSGFHLGVCTENFGFGRLYPNPVRIALISGSVGIFGFELDFGLGSELGRI
ncbi:TMV resistance protein N [Morella rubra]|uniref:ADP-ribosyl cyclase/cyclic ADP-ribose hydrolase n=1 Tax=Morella rubra TaxID=262757 RepID=A0A6A1WM03_9ROSI|nr:TMV resistance protein N [Morella rubra]